MLKKSDIVRHILADRYDLLPKHSSVKAYAPSNIALCKYWGKRDVELNLPVTSSFSISLGDFGSSVELAVNANAEDSVCVNDELLTQDSSFSKRVQNFLDLLRGKEKHHFSLNIKTNIPVAAGLASSACGYASLVRALNLLFELHLTDRELSILARLGSGSASRSLWQGFVEWHKGESVDGMDSYAEPLQETWPDLCIGLLILSDKEKKVSSRDAMQQTVETSPFYSAWPSLVAKDLSMIKKAISEKDFLLLGKTAESNALAMHATMLSARPSLSYALPETIEAMQKIWDLRQAGLNVFFTQDAGPNLKLLFLANDIPPIQSHFTDIKIIQPFKSND